MDPACVNGHVDRLRGTFALLVMLGHSMDLANRHSLVDPLFSPLMNLRPYLGFVWVVGFIVLSGYCIASSCLKAGASMSFRSFLALRATRLFPMLLACLAIAVSLETIMNGSPARPDVWTQGLDDRVVLTANAFGLAAFFGLYGSFAPAYTLSFELVFYVLWGISWFATRRRPGYALLTSAVAIPLLALATRAVPSAVTSPFGLDFTLILYAGWLLGAALAIYLWHPAARRIGRVVAPVRWVLVGLVMIAGRRLYQMPILEPSRVATVYYFALALAFSLVTVGFTMLKRPPPARRIDGILGWISYPLYLVHGPAIVFAAYLLNRRETFIPFTAYVLTACITGVIAASVLTIVIERPVMLLRKKWRRQKTREELKTVPISA